MGYINKLIRLSLLLVSGAVFFVSLSPAMQRKIAAKGLIPDQYRFGDLYNTSNLLKFKEVDFAKNTSLVETDKPKTRYSNVDLYTIGDSFTPMDTSFYAGDKNFHIWLGVNVDTVKLDTAKKSILVVEVIERTIQERLLQEYEGLYIKKGFQIKGDSNEKEIVNPDEGNSFWWDKFGDQINQRIEFLLFNFNPFLKLKELKSAIMLSWFDRTHTGAIISRNHQYLFYTIEADKKSVLSPFHEVTEASVDSVVKHINTIRTYYKNRGFAEVYFCLIPNKVTVCENDRFEYNHQISRIENNPLLETPMISVQATIRKHPEWFHKSDGHWNVSGKRYWLQKTNELVRTWSEK
ncbi:hypothetical protein [Dyadobacter sp. 3J3]|uniref:hypothetical protein n=1 Tax=Dyadobacter sp. 3J3 TaxID=2606600 RepID=UPI001358314D|nr:hypothetical protein [Dyadobacter sp. 3J3]